MAVNAPIYNTIVNYPLGIAGIDTKSDPKTVRLPNVIELKNAIYTNPGALALRYGYQPIGNTPTTGNGPLLPNGRMLTTFNGSELVAADAYRLYSLDAGTNSMVAKGPFQSVAVTVDTVVRNPYTQSGAVGATDPVTGLQCYAWIDSGSGGVNYALVDSNTNNCIVSSTVLDATTGTLPLVACFGGLMLIYYWDTGTTVLSVASIPCSAPLSAPTITVLTTTAGDATQMYATNPAYDVNIVNTPEGPLLYLIYPNVVTSPTNQLTVTVYGATSPVSTPLYSSTLPVADVYFPSCVTVIPNDNYTPATSTIGFAYSYIDTSNSKPYIYQYQIDYRLFTSGTGYLLSEGATSSTVVSLGGYWQTPPAVYTVFASLTVSEGRGLVASYTIRNGNDTVTNTVVAGGCALAAKPFLASGNSLYVPLVQVSPAQTTYFIQAYNFDQGGSEVSSDGVYVADILYGSGGPAPTTILSVCSLIGTAIRLPVLQVDQLESIATPASAGISTLVSQTGVSSVLIDWGTPNPTTAYLHAEIGQNLFISGGLLWNYDGQEICENNFFLYPEGTTLTTNAPWSSGASFSYTFAVVYSRMDAQGQINYSTPEIVGPIKLSTAIGTDGATVTLQIPTLYLSNAENNSVIIYRSQANVDSTIIDYYQDYDSSHTLNSPDNPIINVPTTDWIEFTAQSPDTSTIGNETIYTTGGVLPDSQPGPVSALCTHQNRLYCVVNGTTVWYSKLGQLGVPMEFSNSFILQVPGADITAVFEMDQNLYVFRNGGTIGQSIVYQSGIGPDSTGAQSDYGIPQPVTTDMGCITPRAVALTQAGILFQSEKGLGLLDRSFNVHLLPSAQGYVNQPQVTGSTTQVVNGLTITSPVYTPLPVQITSCVLLANANEVRYSLVTGQVVVYNYFSNTWVTFEGASPAAFQVADATIWDGQYTWLRGDGTIWQETPGAYVDMDGAFISFSLTTAWIKTSELISGFERIREFMIAGDYFSPHYLTVQLRYNNNPVTQWQGTKFVGPGAPPYGGDSTYGGPPDLYYGGSYYPQAPYQFRVFATVQKCSSMQVVLTTSTAGTPGRTASFSGLEIEVAAKKGLWKPRAGVTI